MRNRRNLWRGNDVDNSEDIRNEQTRPIILLIGENMKLKKR